MILPGRVIARQNIVQAIQSAKQQIQPCGIDLTLKRVLVWKTPGVVDFDNSRRENAAAEAMSFHTDAAMETTTDSAFIDLRPGSFLVEFNEIVDVPLDKMGQIFVRSSLFRSGALLNAGVMDSGYNGAVGALLQIVNPYGMRLWRNARLAQIVFHQMTEPTEGYQGVYQGRQAL
jgi:dUTP pyrophosphatase